MKKVQFAVLAAGLLLAAAAAQSQSIQVKANVPFDFIVGSSTLPAGEYKILTTGANEKALVIRGSDAQMLTLSQSCRSLNASDKTKLVFRRYGREYFLAEIWVAGNNAGHQLPKSRREAEMALNHSAEQVVVFAALR